VALFLFCIEQPDHFADYLRALRHHGIS